MKARRFTYAWTIQPHSGGFTYRVAIKRSDGESYLTFADTLWGAKRLVGRYVRRSERATRISKIEGAL